MAYNPKKNLEDLKFGEMNQLRDSPGQLTLDPRRTSVMQALRRGVTDDYKANQIAGKTLWNGIIIRSTANTIPIAANSFETTMSSYQMIDAANPSPAPNFTYKVYVSELDSFRGPITSLNEQNVSAQAIVNTYVTAFPAPGAVYGALAPGTPVTIAYNDKEYGTQPIIMDVDFTRVVPLEGVDPLKYQFSPEAMAARANLPGGGGVGVIGSSAGGSRPSGPVAGEPQGLRWSNKAKQDKITWITAPYAGTVLYNGDIEASGMLETDAETGAKLVKPAMADFRRMAAAYKAKFGIPLKGSGYRTYAGQVRARKLRIEGYHACPEHADRGRADGGGGERSKSCGWIGLAATPGTSNHGWGAAVDLDRSEWKNSKKKDSSKSPQYRWLNKFSHKWNFVFGVDGEYWHVDWKKFSSNVKGLPRETAQTAWNSHGQNDDTITLT